MPFSADDVSSLLASAITETKTAPAADATRIAAALAPLLTPALQDLTGNGPLMTASEALFVRDAVAEELNANGGAEIAERLIRAGYIDVLPILEAHRKAPASSPATVGALTGPLPVPLATPGAGTPFVPVEAP